VLGGPSSSAINRQRQKQKQDDSTSILSHDNRILILADVQQDPIAKALVPAPQDALSSGDDATNNNIGIPGGVYVDVFSEWADLLAASGKGLTTLIRAAAGVLSKSSRQMLKQDGARPHSCSCLQTQARTT
jgi:hypothetical protein